jgi:hypothetical protein
MKGAFTMNISLDTTLIRELWGEQGKAVIKACRDANTTPMSMNEFLSHCTACGGNWSGMLLSGIKALCPEVWDAIPDDMGHHAWACLCEVIKLLGVYTEEDEEKE